MKVHNKEDYILDYKLCFREPHIVNFFYWNHLCSFCLTKMKSFHNGCLDKTCRMYTPFPLCGVSALS